MYNKASGKEKKMSSSKKVHRRVVTEMEEPPLLTSLKPQAKKTQRPYPKPKYIDVYSKYLNRESNPQKKTYKIGTHKPLNIERHMRTQPDEPPKSNNSLLQAHKAKLGNKYQIEGVAGKGTFGVVYMAVERGTGDKVAIKKVFQDKKYKNREHQILALLNNPNTLACRDSFMTQEGGDQYLNIVMDYYPANLYQSIRKKQVNSTLLKLYAYQMFRGLNYLAMLSVAHRDIKPQNILVDGRKLVITDFGSAKQLVKNEPNLAYICSRCYRAPELIFGATDYTPQIDVWSAGCVLVEMINGQPPFMGDSQVDQLIQIIKVLGTPSKIEVEEMNHKYDMSEYAKFPRVKTTPWKHLLHTKDPILIDLVTKVLQYSPKTRLTPAEVMLHQLFDQLRDEARYNELLFKLKALPELFDFSEEQLAFMTKTSRVKGEPVPAWFGKKRQPTNLTNKATSVSTNAKRSMLSFK